jgi:hypothetical protein
MNILYYYKDYFQNVIIIYMFLIYNIILDMWCHDIDWNGEWWYFFDFLPSHFMFFASYLSKVLSSNLLLHYY